MVALVAVVTGCGGAYRYDSRLVAADSLMSDNPDSALALIKAIVPDSLTDMGDRAYRDLLLTQARYKCYITATSDSDINRALDYYSGHSGEREKLTRSYIYKGAVMEELGHPDSAMYYYKTAEANAAPDDYFNLGYVNLRIAELYQALGSNKKAALASMRKAAKYFSITRDTSYLITAIGSQGVFLYDNNKDSAQWYFEKAINLGEAIHSSERFRYQSKLAGLHFYNQEYVLAKDLAMNIIHNGRKDCSEDQFYYYAAWSFIRLSHVDSALWVKSILPAPVSLVDSMNYYRLNAELAEAAGNHKEQIRYLVMADDLNNQLLNKSLSNNVSAQELKVEAMQQVKNTRTSLLQTFAWIITLLFFVFSIALFGIRKRVKARLLAAQADIEESRQLLDKEIKALQASQLADVSQAVRIRLSALDELYQEIRVKGCTLGNSSHHPLPLRGLIKDMNDRKELMYATLKDSFWNKLKSSIDIEYPGLVNFVDTNFPDLTLKERQLFLLWCGDVPPQIMKLCLGYEHVVTVSNYKKRLMKKLCGVNISLSDFIQGYLDEKMG